MVPSAFETWVNETSLVRGAEQLFVLVEQDLAAVVDGDDAQARAFFRASICQGTMLAWCSIQVMTISSPLLMLLAAPALRDQVDGLGGAADEDDLLGRGRVEEAARLCSRASS
jgi:hypothetical protein